MNLAELSKDTLVEMHRAAFGTVGDTARTSKPQYIEKLSTLDDVQLIAAHATASTKAAAPINGSAPGSTDEIGAQLLTLIRSIAGNAVNEDRVRALIAEHFPPDTGLSEETVRSIVAEEMAKLPSQTLEITSNGTTRTVEGLRHKMLPALIKALGARCQVWLVGPTGSGKTHAAEQAAEALGVPFFFNGAIDTEYKLLGFVAANGTIISTAFREAFTNGGVYLFDETDASMPAATLAFNAALSNGYADFPGGMVKRHADFYPMAAANTWGLGATNDYVGRNRMDAAFLNRFVRMHWDYDEALELSLAGDADWTQTVQAARAKAKQNGLKVVISPRDSINGARLIAAGFKREEAIAMTFGAGLSPEQLSNLGV